MTDTPFKRTGRDIFIVMGTTGEYSDRSEWPVACFDTEAKAMDVVKALDEWASGMTKRKEDDYDWWRSVEWGDRRGERESWPDPGLKLDYTGTTYYVMQVGCAE